MNITSDFKIKSGILLKYTGKNSSVSIPNRVKSIGSSAFVLCDSLEEILIPDSVNVIDDNAFSFCKALKEIIIPNGVTSIGDSAFSFCESLNNAVLPDSITTIGNAAFILCKSLKEIVIPTSVTHIGDSAFAFCKSLKKITVPDSVESIGCEAFKECNNAVITLNRSSITKEFEDCLERSLCDAVFAPRLQLSDFHNDNLIGALSLGFIKNVSYFSDKIKKEYTAYIKKNEKTAAQFTLYALDDESAMLYLSENNLIPYDKLDSLLEKVQGNNNPSITTILIEYKNKFKSEIQDEFELGTL